jgi:hypothetical protein
MATYSQELHVDCTNAETTWIGFILQITVPNRLHLFPSNKFKRNFVNKNDNTTEKKKHLQNWVGSNDCGGKCQSLQMCPQAQQLVTQKKKPNKPQDT